MAVDKTVAKHPQMATSLRFLLLDGWREAAAPTPRRAAAAVGDVFAPRALGAGMGTLD